MSGKASNMPASGVLSLGEAVASGLALLLSIALGVVIGTTFGGAIKFVADSKVTCRLER